MLGADIFRLAGAFLLLASTSATPVAVPDDAACTKLKTHTFEINGDTHNALTSSMDLEVKFDGKVVCSKQRRECNAGSKNCDYRPNCIPGWSFFVKEGPMVGPWKYDIQGLPKERIFLQGKDTSTISTDDIDCDGYNCGGGECHE